MFGAANRTQGVMAPPGAVESAPVKKLTNFIPLKFAAIEYGDVNGRKHRTVVMTDGTNWYVPENGELWAEKLSTPSTWLLGQLSNAMAAYESSNAPVSEEDLPNADAVEVIGQKGARK